MTSARRVRAFARRIEQRIMFEEGRASHNMRSEISQADLALVEAMEEYQRLRLGVMVHRFGQEPPNDTMGNVPVGAPPDVAWDELGPIYTRSEFNLLCASRALEKMG
jgi:hypothetical protein